MTREPIEVTRQDRIYCLKVSSDYHSEVCEECKFYPKCDHMTQDDLTELTIKDLEALEQEPVLNKIKAEIEAKCCITVGRENDCAITLHDVFEIIDKYKAESEDKE